MHSSLGGPDRACLGAVALWLSLAGCAGLRASEARDGYFQEQLASSPYPQACDRLWPDVLRLLAAKGYALAGRDRQIAGEPSASGVDRTLSNATETRPTADGGLEVATAWNYGPENPTRYRVTGTPAGPGACWVTFTRVWQGVVDPASHSTARDWQLQLKLLQVVAPEAAAKLEAGAPKP